MVRRLVRRLMPVAVVPVDVALAMETAAVAVAVEKVEMLLELDILVGSCKRLDNVEALPTS